MKITCILNDIYDPAGVVGDTVEARGFDLDVLHPHGGDALPDGLVAGSAGLIVLGGLMHAFEDDRFPALRRISDMIAEAHHAGVPVLGICLGAQLLARALGKERVSMDGYEFGFVPLSPTAAARGDRLLSGLDVPPIMQGHEDNFELPEEAELLLTGDWCRNQAFRVGETSYGFQCHFEVTRDIVEEWVRQARTSLAHRLGDDPQGFLDAVERDVPDRLPSAQAFARAVTGRWLDLVAERRGTAAA